MLFGGRHDTRFFKGYRENGGTTDRQTLSPRMGEIILKNKVLTIAILQDYTEKRLTQFLQKGVACHNSAGNL